ncbi:MAG: FAD-binding protein, partial [Gammaproteobacteria bacterium]|nr:FAD-binding protein [Gammaproteobacteria bacterium]
MTNRAGASINKQQLVAELQTILPPQAVIHETEALRPYECDGLSAYRRVPLVTVLPESREQVVQIMQLCHRRKIPVVARGAATGLSGGALPLADG